MHLEGLDYRQYLDGRSASYWAYTFDAGPSIPALELANPAFDKVLALLRVWSRAKARSADPVLHDPSRLHRETLSALAQLAARLASSPSRKAEPTRLNEAARLLIMSQGVV